MRLANLLQLHLAVFLFGATALFAKFMTVSTWMMVFGRTFIAGLVLVPVLLFFKQSIKLKSWQDCLGFFLMGAILALHWVTFFYSIQISTVAIGLLTFSTFPVFVTFLEPLFFKEKIRGFDVFISIVVFAGLVLVVPEFNLENNMTLGVIWGVVAGLTCAILTILNRKYVSSYSSLTLAFYQNLIAALLLLPVVGSSVLEVNRIEWGELIILGVIFTALAQVTFIQGMMNIKAQLASVICALEPVYGIALAYIFLNEALSQREILGGIIIISGIIIATRKPVEL